MALWDSRCTAVVHSSPEPPDPLHASIPISLVPKGRKTAILQLWNTTSAVGSIQIPSLARCNPQSQARRSSLSLLDLFGEQNRVIGLSTSGVGHRLHRGVHSLDQGRITYITAPKDSFRWLEQVLSMNLINVSTSLLTRSLHAY